MADYVPHTEEEVAAMLDFLGLASLEDLFAHIPAALRLSGGLDVGEGLSEPDVTAQFARYGASNRATSETLTCFAGAGAYDHEVPAVVRALASRSEFVTSYTPYQPEVAQGVLEALFEYQTMVSRLSGLPIANASLYDGAAALVESLNVAAAATRRTRVVISAGVHPHWRDVARTFAQGTGHEIVEAPLVNGVTDWSRVDSSDAAAMVVAYPNVLGVVEDVGEVRRRASEHGALLVVAGDPVSAGVLRSAGSWGADVFVGEGQPLGTPLSFGGPYLGLFACTTDQVRRLPGRIVGESVDADNRRAFVMTLRAREQDIRRERATSNVCTNQTLMAVTAAIQLGWLGRAGLREVATRGVRGAHYLHDALVRAGGVSAVSDQPFVREFALRLARPAASVIDAMAERGILAGVALDSLTGADESVTTHPEDVLLVAVTERRTRDELDAYVAAFAEAVAS